jgi:hypothetical protein
MSEADLKDLIYNTAVALVDKGAGWAQEGALLYEVAQKVPASKDIGTQREILTCWHDLFRDGKLSWGFNLDNPNWPFFHVPRRDGKWASAGRP